ncbi:protein of unknown function [Methanoculleus bourgensis]|uniref:Uncharacterized protein n=1 Tax=Methanoculleus bourgensis TaxID=83986 RepID=A0A0X3BJ79_9EURY|nr:protein of unknown function [Methanoculleus bourgensis]
MRFSAVLLNSRAAHHLYNGTDSSR